jgi:hypothetical protein
MSEHEARSGQEAMSSKERQGNAYFKEPVLRRERLQVIYP